MTDRVQSCGFAHAHFAGSRSVAFGAVDETRPQLGRQILQVKEVKENERLVARIGRSLVAQPKSILNSDCSRPDHGQSFQRISFVVFARGSFHFPRNAEVYLLIDL